MVPSGWESIKLKEILSSPVKNGFSPNSIEQYTSYVVLGLGALTDNKLNVSEVKNVIYTEKIEQSQLRDGDFLVSRSNTPKKVGRSALFRGEIANCSYPDLMMKFRIEEAVANREFIEAVLQSSEKRQYFTNCAAGSSSTMVKITKGTVEQTPLMLPPLPEQQKIAKILSTWDKAISTTEALIDNSKQQKKALMQQLLTVKKRFAGFGGEWEEVKLSEWIVEYKEKSTVQDQHDVYTSSRNGLVLQSEYFGNSRILERDNIGFHVIPPQHMTYRSRSDDGFFTFNLFSSSKKGIISNYYPVFNSRGSNTFFIALFEHYRSVFRKYSVGTSQKVLSLNALKKIKFRVPSAQEQQKIASVLTNADKEIELLKQQLADLKQEKKALMQQLLTGKRRVKIDKSEAALA